MNRSTFAALELHRFERPYHIFGSQVCGRHAMSSNRKIPAFGAHGTYGLKGGARRLPRRIENETETSIAGGSGKAPYQTKRLRMLALSRGQTELLGAMSGEAPLRDIL